MTNWDELWTRLLQRQSWLTGLQATSYSSHRGGVLTAWRDSEQEFYIVDALMPVLRWDAYTRRLEMLQRLQPGPYEIGVGEVLSLTRELRLRD